MVLKLILPLPFTTLSIFKVLVTIFFLALFLSLENFFFIHKSFWLEIFRRIFLGFKMLRRPTFEFTRRTNFFSFRAWVGWRRTWVRLGRVSLTNAKVRAGKPSLIWSFTAELLLTFGMETRMLADSVSFSFFFSICRPIAWFNYLWGANRLCIYVEFRILRESSRKMVWSVILVSTLIIGVFGISVFAHPLQPRWGRRGVEPIIVGLIHDLFTLFFV